MRLPGSCYQQEGAVQGAAFSPGGLHERITPEQAGGQNRSSVLPQRWRQPRLLHRLGDQRGYGKGVLHEPRGVDDVPVGGGGGQGGVASPPATAAPPTQQSISFEVVPPLPPAPAATAAPPAAACSSPLPSPAPAPAATAAPSAAARTSPLPPPNEYDLEVCQFDVDQAFVRADLKEDAFMRLPEGCGALSGKNVKLNKSLYGLRQASRQ